MIKARKFIKLIALATGLATAHASFGANGDIFEIRPCDDTGADVTYNASMADPMVSGESLYFKVRLIQRVNKDTASTWKLKYTGSISEEIDGTFAPLQIGIYVSGERRFADLVNYSTSDDGKFTDLIFKYKTRAGDIALPIVLATEDGPASDNSQENVSYLLYNDDKWQIVNDRGNECNFWFWSYSAADPSSAWTGAVQSPDGGDPIQDYSLAKCNFYVQTVDFDGTWESEGKIWRSVHQNSTVTGGGLVPRLEALAAPEDKVTLYVWSADDNIVKVKSTEQIDLKTDAVGTTQKTFVGTVTLAGGQMSADFQIEGVGDEGKETFLVLSPWKGYNYSIATGARIVDFMTVPVKCLAPLPPTVVVEADRTIANANGNYMTYAAVLNVYLTQALDTDLEVTIKPSLANGVVPATGMGEYVRFAEDRTEVTALPEYAEPKVVIPAGSTAKKQIYVFCLKGDVNTSGTSRLVFEPAIPASAQSAIKNFTSAGMEVRAESPVIVRPADGEEIAGVCGDEIPFTIEVSDTYADSSDVTKGYSIYVRYRATDTFAPLSGTYYVGEGNVLYALQDDGAGGFNKTTNLPTLNYPASGEDLKSEIYIVSPVSGKKSEVRSFIADIKEARTSKVEVFDALTGDARSVFNEGDEANFKVTLSEKNDTGDTIYAFLKPSGNVTADMFASSGSYAFIIGMANPIGLPINKNQSESALGGLTLVEGMKKPSGLDMVFEVVLSYSQNDPSDVISGYDSNYLSVKVHNVEPVIKHVLMNGFKSKNDGFVFSNKVPKNMEQTFKVVVDDPGEYDLTNTQKPFKYRWTASLAGVGDYDTQEVEGNPNDNPLTYTFPQAGDWTITFEVMDKDMSDYSEITYSVGVTVLDNPIVDVVVPEAIDENDSQAKVQVQLSYWDMRRTDPLKVKITVNPYGGVIRDNPGFIKLDSSFRSPVAGEENVYYVNVVNSLPIDLLVEEMDGTQATSLYGFEITAEIVTEDNLPTSNSPANKYYIQGKKRVFVNNVAPTYQVSPLSNSPSNRWVVAGGVDRSHPINWQVKSDVSNDFNGSWSGSGNKGVKVTFMGCKNETSIFVTSPRGETFYPDFGDVQGDVDLTMMVEDKDGSSQIITWYYKVTPSKFLTTIANGPNGGTSTSALSRKYSLLGSNIYGSLGEGHTYVAGATFSSGSNFRLKWNCSKATSAEIYAFGYKVDSPLDNGALDNAFDIAIDPTGAAQAGVKPGSYYEYEFARPGVAAENRKDSFFYCWILHGSNDSGEGESSILGGAILPERPGQVSSGRVTLPNEQTEDGGYINTEVEAIFAREWLPADNLGDINRDGIPDIFAHSVFAGGNLIELASGGDILENDLIELANFNGDEDYLPGVFNGGNSYAPIGPDFAARLEIRGFHEGLNALDMTKSDASFSEEEIVAWRAATGAADDAMPDASTDLTRWSPEPSSDRYPRMDPTVADTDGDGMPDGWEYYFWYQAHVTKFAKPDKVKFERFDLNNIVKGIEITAAEVEARFNPCAPLDASVYADNPDFDRDGLSDLEELAIGTNPCHWDTDGDGMCDGWEVMMSLDPINGEDKSSNPDNDFMAYYSTYGVPGKAEMNDDGVVIAATVFPDLVAYVDYNPLTGKILADIPSAKAVKFKTVQTLDDGTVVEHLYGKESDVPKDIPNGWVWGFGMVHSIEVTEIALTAEEVIDTKLRYVLVHDQVREVFGFDPRTAWSNIYGYVADRWNPTVNSELKMGDETGRSINTKEYSNYDEYLVMKYRKFRDLVEADGYKHPGELDIDVVKDYANFDNKDMWGIIMYKTTNPNVVYPQNVSDDTQDAGDVSDDTASADDGATDAVTTNKTASANIAEMLDKAFAEAGSSRAPVKTHGADTDQDGVPDGWELYMFRNPNAKPAFEENGIGSSGMRDFDGDQLSLVNEYAGTDSCNCHSDCETIYKNHPGNVKGWFNKFFPTNPGSKADPADGADTDKDGISDAQEGANFTLDFYNRGDVYTGLKLGFVYGSPVDNNKSCIRGGGMNPCTIDTDLDGLPDGWEMQHAGVPADATTKLAVPPLNGGKVGTVKISDGTFVADGVFKLSASASGSGNSDSSTNAVDVAVSTNSTPAASIVYIAGGMDATWAGDVCTDATASGLSYDSLLKTVRDVDFDNDGLQNFQEYLIQSVRHFRYDDVSTPLMGRLFTETADYDKVEHSQELVGWYIPFNAASGDAFAAEYAILKGDTNGRDTLEISAERVSKPWNEEGWRLLGYFASPVQPWDCAVVSRKLAAPIYMQSIVGEMLTKSVVAGYATTDPRMADTDGDGMDDFYEMFHGLNPILGTNVDAPHASTWSGEKRGDIISAIYNESVAPRESLATFNAYFNEWIYPSYNGVAARAGMPKAFVCAKFGSIKAPQAYDPVLYPWIMGTAMADADGDGLRNDSERIAANVADPMPRHTDPTPRWFTERTTPISYVAQYYVTPTSIALMPWLPSVTTDFELATLAGTSGFTYMYSFEEGEGYDTDGDMKHDAAEVVAGFTSETDPQMFNDPDRRQALWLDGVNSYAMTVNTQFRPIHSSDLFKQFTVECWARPEKDGVDQTILERSALYAGDSLNNSAAAIRANFRIGIFANGKVYGMFDNDESIESGANTTRSCQFVEGPVLKTGEWAHIALTFDGAVLKLYVNGEQKAFANTSLIPANGVNMIVQNPGSTNAFPAVSYSARPSALFVGARPVKASDVKAGLVTVPEMVMTPCYTIEGRGVESFDNMREFFCGWIDEVRVWDGVRTQAEISGSYNLRYGFNEALANRESVATAWVLGATRNNNDGAQMLPAELIYHYNFATLPSAVDGAQVAKAPAGFKANVLEVADGTQYSKNGEIDTEGLYDQAALRDTGIAHDLLVGWWASTQLRNTVYDNYYIVPWIQNTVGHLPAIDGTSVDTFLYSKNFGSGYTLVGEHGVPSLIYPDTANPYSSVVDLFDRYQKLFQARRIVEQYGSGFITVEAYAAFAARSAFIGTTDLIPLGGAFAKACSKMWDRAASDVWELTGEDSDADGMPDWWENIAKSKYGNGSELTWDTIVERNGVKMTAGQAYKFDLYSGMQPGKGEIKPEYKANVDTDGDNLPDWWEKTYDIFASSDVDDDDGDGLSNWAEYLLSEVFDLGIRFNPTDAKSVNGFDLDYFIKIGDVYVGEIFSDHDFIEDINEDAWGAAYSSRYKWDALSDADEDGWSNFAEARYNDFTKSIIPGYTSHILGDTEIRDMPTPALKLTLRYNGYRSLNGEDGEEGGSENLGSENDSQVSGSLAPIVVRTYSDAIAKPDAEFVVMPGQDSLNTSYIGPWESKTVSGTLTPGYVNGSSLTLEFADIGRNGMYSFYVADLRDVSYSHAMFWPEGYHLGTYEDYMSLYKLFGGEYIQLQAVKFEWGTVIEDNAITVTQDTSGEEGYICLNGERIGKINLKSGDYTLDLAPFESFGTSSTNYANTTVSMAQKIFRFKYNSVVPAMQSNKLELFLGDATKGYVKEGTNMIVAFYDLDGNGDYTPGEPMGTATGVDIGWNQAKAELELTDTSVVITRADLVSGASDRDNIWGSESGDVLPPSSSAPSSTKYQRIRILRTLVNGYPVWGVGAPATVVYDGVLNLSERSYIFEGDILKSGELDIDWKSFATEALPAFERKGIDPVEVAYSIVFGNGEIDLSQTNNYYAICSVRRFDAASARPTPVSIAPGAENAVIFDSHPTFKWKLPGGENTYTAFRVQILDGQQVVWDSGERRAPARNLEGEYTFEADAYIDAELENFKSYTWRVSMYNSKFRTDLWSTEGYTFRMNAPTVGAGYANVPVCVKYFGPANVAGASEFVVEAFKSPDFSGMPAARAVVTDLASITEAGVTHPTNAVLNGLVAGRYYLRAYADLNVGEFSNSKRDDVESWGYYCGRGKPGARPYTPIALDVTDRNGFEKPFDIYLEDVDTNGNCLPDAWEIVNNGGTLDKGANNIDGTLANSLAINKQLANVLASSVVGKVQTDAYNNYIMTAFSSPAMTALALGYKPSDITVTANGSIAVASEVESVSITSVAFDPNGNVSVTVEGALNTADGNLNGFGFIPLVGAAEKSVTCTVYYKSTLAQANWDVAAVKTIVVGSSAQTIDIGGLGKSASGFFKVVVTE